MTDENDVRIRRLFDNYDKDKDGRISCEDFQEFYKDSIVSKESTVWSNIRSWDYRTDLRKGLHREKRNPTTLLRYGLPQTQEFYDYFFNLLELGNDDVKTNEFDYFVSKNSWELIKRLSIHPQTVQNLIEFKNYDSEGNEIEFKFENLINCNNPFHIIYFLQLITYLIGYESRTETLDVIYNEDEPVNNTVNEGEVVYGPHLKVTGHSVGSSTQAVNNRVPPPIPAIPIDRLNNSNLVTSESGKGKAEVVAPASKSGNVPKPPPMPAGRTGDGSYIKNDNHVKFVDEKSKNQMDEEEEWYPPRGKNDKTPEKDSKSKEDDKEYYNYQEIIPQVNGYCENLTSKSRSEWIKEFLDKGGFDFILSLLLSKDSFLNKKIESMETMKLEEKQSLEEILKIICMFVSVSNVSNFARTLKSENQTPSQLPVLHEDQAIDFDDYEIDENALMEKLGETKPLRERTVSSVAHEEDLKEQQDVKIRMLHIAQNDSKDLLEALTVHYSDKILKEVPYENFFNYTLGILAHLLTKRDLTEKDIAIVNVITTIHSILCIINEDLLEYFYNFYDEKTKLGIKEIIIKGLTYMQQTQIKQLFIDQISNLTRNIKRTTHARLPLITDYRGYGYKEYFDVFSQLIHQYFQVQDVRNDKFEEIINPKFFIVEIVNLLQKYKTKEKRNCILEDHCLIGLFSILERLLQDKTEYIEEMSLEHGLLHEIFFNCLFQDMVDAPQIDLTVNFDFTSTDVNSNKCKTKESRAKAFCILNLLCTNSSKVRDYVYKNCLIKMISKIERPESFAYVPESESRSLYNNSGLKNLGAT